MTTSRFFLAVPTLCASVVLFGCPSDEAESGSTGSETSGSSEDSETDPTVTTTMTVTDTQADSSTDPTNPTDASSSTDPTDASSSTDPTDASSSTDPTDASSSTDPTDASSSTDPTDASSSTDPTGGSSDTGALPGVGYGDCINNPVDVACIDGEVCLTDPNATLGFCSLPGCVDASDCPSAASGDAIVGCLDGDMNGTADCFLNCAMGETCPDGMTCLGQTVCVWELENAGGGLPLEDFEGGALPAGWSVIDVDDQVPAAAVAYVDQAFVVVDNVEPGLNFAAYSTSWYAPVGQSDDWLVTPSVQLGAASVLSWDARAPDPAFPDGYEVRISTATPTTADFLDNAALLTVAAELPDFNAREIDLAAAGYANQAVYIAFRNTSNDQFLLMIDNVEVQ